MTDAYTEHFRFTKSPFDPNADSRSVYPSRSYVAACSEILEAIERREGVIVLTGESGMGKTTLCRSIARSGPGQSFVSEIVDPTLTATDLLAQILGDFGAQPPATPSGGLTSTPPYDLVLAIGAFLEGVPSTARALLVIDDAHYLQAALVAQLRALANLRGPAGRSLQILLVGHPSLIERLREPDMPQLDERIARRIELRGLERDEIELYIQHRLAVARAAHTSLDDLVRLSSDQEIGSALRLVSVSPAAIRHLAALSKGAVRLLNLLCDRALEVALERLTYDIGADIVRQSARRLDMPLSIARRLAMRPAASLLSIGVVAGAASLWWATNAMSSRVSLELSTPLLAAAPQAPGLALPAPVAAVQPPPPQPVADTELAPEDRKSGEAAPVAAPRSSAGSLVLKLGAFRNEQNAANAISKLRQMDLPAFGIQSGPWHLVLAGPYSTISEARSVLARISAEEFPNAHVTRQSQVGTPAPHPADAPTDGQSAARAN